MYKICMFLCSFLLFLENNTFAQPAIDFDLVVSGFSSPVDMTHAGDERLFVVERSGRIKILIYNYDEYTAEVFPTHFLDIDNKVINTGGQSEQGLLGLAFHPNYTENGYFFVHYTNNSGDGVIARYSVSANDPNIADPGSEQIIMTIQQPYSNHNGGCIKFGPDGYLYIGLGDGGSANDPQNYAQNRLSLLGKMLRIDVDNGDPYTIPLDNPFAMDDFTLDEIWAIGLRNPWRFSFDSETGDMWMGDVGQGQWEEVNFQPVTSNGGENYGWRCYEGNHAFNTSGCQPISAYTAAVAEYNHQGFTHCSVTGGYVYRGSSPGLQGLYFYADYCSGQVWATRQNNGTFDTFELDRFSGGNIVSFGEDVHGEIYAVTLQGRVYRLLQDCSTNENLSLVHENGVLSISDAFESYQWYRNDVPIEGATTSMLEVTEVGVYYVEVIDAMQCLFTSNIATINMTNTQELPSIKALQLHPNPTSEDVVLTFQSTSTEGVQLLLYDLNGKEIFQTQIVTKHNNQLSLPTQHLDAGVYILTLQTKEGSISRRVVKE